MKTKNRKHYWQHNRGGSTTLVLGTIATVGILTAAVYSNNTRESVKGVLDPVAEHFKDDSGGKASPEKDNVGSNQAPNQVHASTAVQPPESRSVIGAPDINDANPPAYKDPIIWLEQALNDLDEKEARLKPRQFKLKLITNKFSRKRTQAMSEEESWTDLLDELKQAYRGGEATGTFPVIFHDYSIQEDLIKQKIVQAHQLVIEQGKLRATYGRQANRSKALGSKVTKVLDEIAHARRIVSIKLDVARTEKELQGLGDVREEVGTILDTAEALVEQADHLSLFELRENTKPRGYTSEQFTRIMEGK